MTDLESVLLAFAKMDKAKRTALIKLLKAAKVKLDYQYPDGYQAPPSPSQTTQTI